MKFFIIVLMPLTMLFFYSSTAFAGSNDGATRASLSVGGLRLSSIHFSGTSKPASISEETPDPRIAISAVDYGARTASSWSPAGSIFATIVGILGSGIAAVMFSPVMRQDSSAGPPIIGAFALAVAPSVFVGMAIDSTRHRPRGTSVRASLNGVTIRW